MAKYIITGGCGFIGSHLGDALITAGHEVLVIDNLSTGFRKNLNPKAELVVANVCNLKQIEEIIRDVDGCFHLAAIPSVVMPVAEWQQFHTINLTATINVLQTCIANGNIPVAYASSCAVYGDCPDLPLTEDKLITPLSAYGVDKYSCELNAKIASLNYGLATFGLRIFNVYGPRQNPRSIYSGVIAKFIEALRLDKPITIYGDGEQTRDFVYVTDIVASLIHAMESASDKAPTANACTGKITTVNQLATILAKILNKKLEIDYQPPRNYDVLHSCGNPEKARQFAINCEVSIETGLKPTVDYYCQ